MTITKMCPLLTGKKEIRALAIGDGDVVIPTFNVCMKRQ